MEGLISDEGKAKVGSVTWADLKKSDGGMH
jgi:hypothetical protein